jgi:site-specific recombinase XerD
VARVRRFVLYLSQQGLVDFAQKKAKDVHPASVVEFSHWMQHHRGVSPRTIARYVRCIISLLPTLGRDPALYDAAGIRQTIEHEAMRHTRGTAQGYATALRAYLRFLAAQGQCRAGLEAAVPTFPQWKLSALPRYLVADDLDRVIAAYDSDTRCGLRNRAILLLLARLGLRAGDIVHMRMDDLDWDEGTLRVRGKGRREIRLPLPQDAGDALLAYLEHARPPVAIDRVFLCVPAPYRAFASSVVVSGIVQGALARAGIANPPSRGANLLRHSAATSMLRAGATLDAISSVLRHRSLDTTVHYAKVDTAMLQPIAQPWPEEDSSC